MVGSMAYALYMYQTTKDMTLSGGQHPWSPQTVLWPTFMVLSTAGVTFIMNIIILSAYMCGAMAADKTSTIMGYIGYGITAIHVVVWVINAGLFKMAFTGRDLWGFSCSTEADALQAQVKSVLNYTTLCQIQVRDLTTTHMYEDSRTNLGDLDWNLDHRHHRNNLLPHLIYRLYLRGIPVHALQALEEAPAAHVHGRILKLTEIAYCFVLIAVHFGATPNSLALPGRNRLHRRYAFM